MSEVGINWSEMATLYLFLCVLWLPLCAEDDIGVADVLCVGELSTHSPPRCLLCDPVTLHHPQHHLCACMCVYAWHAYENFKSRSR